MLADDCARRCVDDCSLARAIALVSTGEQGSLPHLADDTWMSSGHLSEARARILRLETAPLPSAQRTAVIGAATALILVPTILLFTPGIEVLLS